MRLYKYVIPDRVDVLRGRRIRFTQAEDFNDPFEVVPHVSAFMRDCEVEPFLRGEVEAPQTIDQVIAEHVAVLPKRFRRAAAKRLRREVTLKAVIAEAKGQLPKIAEANKKTFGRRFQEQSGERIGILSLTEISTDLLMWAHYGSYHRGFVIEFDATHDFFHRSTAQGALGELQRVLYKRQRPAIIAYEPSLDPKAYADNLIRDVLLTKGHDWSYEREWRMVLPLNDATREPHVVDGRVHLFELPADVITGVIVGARATLQLKKDLQQILSTSGDLAHIRIVHCRASDTEYQVTLHDGWGE